MEVPRLGVKLELQLPAYTTVTAVGDLSHIYDLHHNSRQRGTPTHCVRPGIEPESLWIPGGFFLLCHNQNSLALFSMQIQPSPPPTPRGGGRSRRSF